MKPIAGLMLTGILGVLAGSLAAQQLGDERALLTSPTALYDGPLEVELVERGDKFRQNGRVYENWVDLGDQMIPREQIRRLTMQPARRGGDFGDQPGADPNAVPDPNPNTPPKRRPFRED